MNPSQQEVRKRILADIEARASEMCAIADAGNAADPEHRNQVEEEWVQACTALRDYCDRGQVSLATLSRLFPL